MNFLNGTLQPLAADQLVESELQRRIVASIAPIGSERWDLEIVTPSTNHQMEQFLEDAPSHGLEANPFFSANFISAAFKRMATKPTSLLVLARVIDDVRQIRMYMPIEKVRAGIFGPPALKSWSHDYAPLGTPIVGSQDTEETLSRFAELLGKLNDGRAKVLVIGDLPRDMEFATRLTPILKRHGTPHELVATSSRAAFQPSASSDGSAKLAISSKKRRQLNRQLRRLAELGKFEMQCAQGYRNVVVRFEEFLLLEASSWKGRKGTSLRTVKQTAAFARQAVSDMAKVGDSSIYSLRIDGQSIASLVMMQNAGVYYPWKIAFSSEYAQFSPGALLMYKVSEALANEKGFVRADSLAGENNPLVNLLWKDRLELGSLVIALGDDSTYEVAAAAKAITRKHAFKAQAKKLLRR